MSNKHVLLRYHSVCLNLLEVVNAALEIDGGHAFQVTSVVMSAALQYWKQFMLLS